MYFWKQYICAQLTCPPAAVWLAMNREIEGALFNQEFLLIRNIQESKYNME
jgi:hypothetical protein